MSIIRKTGPREILACVGLIMLFVGLSLWSIAVALSTVGALLLLFAAWPYVVPRRSS